MLVEVGQYLCDVLVEPADGAVVVVGQGKEPSRGVEGLFGEVLDVPVRVQLRVVARNGMEFSLAGRGEGASGSSMPMKTWRTRSIEQAPSETSRSGITPPGSRPG